MKRPVMRIGSCGLAALILTGAGSAASGGFITFADMRAEGADVSSLRINGRLMNQVAPADVTSAAVLRSIASLPSEFRSGDSLSVDTETPDLISTSLTKARFWPSIRSIDGVDDVVGSSVLDRLNPATDASLRALLLAPSSPVTPRTFSIDSPGFLPTINGTRLPDVNRD